MGIVEGSQERMKLLFSNLKNERLLLGEMLIDDDIVAQIIDQKGQIAMDSIRRLTYLYLWDNKIGDYGIKLLSRCLTENITNINLCNNKIGDQGIKHLAFCNLLNLTILHLGGNFIGNQGAKDIANTPLINLVQLNLNGNHINIEGSKYLTSGCFGKLSSLEICDNRISEEGLKCILNGPFVSIVTILARENKNLSGKNSRLKYMMPKNKQGFYIQIYLN